MQKVQGSSPCRSTTANLLAPAPSGGGFLVRGRRPGALAPRPLVAYDGHLMARTTDPTSRLALALTGVAGA